MGWTVETIQPRSGDHITFCAVTGTTCQITNMPAAEQEIYAAGATNKRIPANLAGRTRARLMLACGLAGPNGSTMGVQYSLDSGSTWSTSFATVTMVGTVSAPVPGAWFTIPTAGRTEVILRIVTLGGTGGTSPTPQLIVLDIE